MTFTPHRRLSAWYDQLAQQLEAGLTLTDALRTSGLPGTMGADTTALAEVIENCGTLEQAVARAGPWLPPHDRLFLTAAARAGRLTAVLRTLSVHHAQIATARLKLLLASAYPLAVLHVGLLLAPLLAMLDWERGFQWNLTRYLGALSVMLVPLWTVSAAIVLLARRRSPALFALAQRLPGLGRYLKAHALAELAFTLGSLLEAGVPIGQAWAAAGRLARWPELRKAAAAMVTSVDGGQPPGNEIGAWGCFPPDFVALYRTGERTGRLDESLAQLAAQNHARAAHAMNVVTILYPGLLFLGVAGLVAYHVIRFYGGYFKMLGDLAR